MIPPGKVASWMTRVRVGRDPGGRSRCSITARNIDNVQPDPRERTNAWRRDPRRTALNLIRNPQGSFMICDQALAQWRASVCDAGSALDQCLTGCTWFRWGESPQVIRYDPYYLRDTPVGLPETVSEFSLQYETKQRDLLGNVVIKKWQH